MKSLPRPSPEAAARLAAELPEPWRAALASVVEREGFAALAAFLEEERQTHEVYPPPTEVFAALKGLAPEAVRAVVLGQDPYHGPGQAHGFAFSVPPGVKKPPSLFNLLRELHDDVGCPVPESGDLRAWSSQGVLLLNTVLTVRASEAGSHRRRGWEALTGALIAYLSATREGVVFLLWGADAQARRPLIDERRHIVLCSAHPSPLSAWRGFLGSSPFSRANEARVARGLAPIDWCLPSASVEPGVTRAAQGAGPYSSSPVPSPGCAPASASADTLAGGEGSAGRSRA